MICILKHLNVVLVKDKVQYHYKCDSSGMETEENVSNNKYPGGEVDERKYFCTNCLKYWPGDETFDEARSHLGKHWG